MLRVVIEVHYCLILYYGNKMQFPPPGERKVFRNPSAKMTEMKRISKQAVYKIVIPVNINIL